MSWTVNGNREYGIGAYVVGGDFLYDPSLSRPGCAGKLMI